MQIDEQKFLKSMQEDLWQNCDQ